MKNVKIIVGLLLMLIGLLCGAYVGLYLCFIGGIVDLMEVISAAIKTSGDIEAIKVAYGVVKIMFAGVAFWISAALCMAPGYALVKSGM